MNRHRAVDRKRSHPLAGLLGLSLLLLLSSAACRSEPEDSQVLEPVLRFIAHDPQTMFQPDPLIDPHSRFAASELIAHGTKVTLDGEVRNALIALPGLPVERRLEVPQGASLHFSYGAQRTAPLALHFRISAEPDDGDAMLLFEASLVAESDLDQWHQAEVDLASLAGRTVRFELTVGTEEQGFKGGPAESRRGISVWGNPEVLAPSRRRPLPNVVLISIDTLRSDRMSVYGHQRSTTPNLEAWARRSATVFSHAVAQAPWTLPSHVSLLTGRNAHRQADLLPYSPTAQGSELVGVAESALMSRHLLAERLRELGFSTLAVTGGAFLHPRFGFSQGFDRFRYYGGPRAASEDELQVGMETALEWLAEYQDRSFFLFFHSYEVHGPFLAREPYFSRFSDAPAPNPRIRNSIDLRHIEAEGFLWKRPFFVETASGVDPEELFKAVYDSGIAYTDVHLDRLLQTLAESGLDRRTIVVVTSDHGHLIGEHGLIGHHYLYDENLLVPLMIAGPSGRGAGRRVSQQVRLVDVVPTVLELAGLPLPEGVDGVSLAPWMDGRAEDAPDEAWSYASRANRGISIRINNQLKYVFNNTAWAPLHGQETVFRLGGAGEEEIPILQVPEIESLRRRVRKTLDQQVPGLRMRFQTDASSSFSGTLRGPLVGQNTVKSSDMACACMTWLAHGEAAFEAPPGRTFTVNFEQAGGGDFVLSLASERGGETAVFEQTIDPGALDGSLVVALTPSGWRSGPAPLPASRATISFWWVGKHRPVETPFEAPDAALKARLEALGYLD